MNLAALLCVFCLHGCAGGGFSLKQAEVDRSLYTSAVPNPGAPKDAGRVSDEVTIRNAVSSADIESLGGQALPWANADTGARGSITELSESRQNAMLCRRFTTSRESFDGIRLFKGETCMSSAGVWLMREFAAL